MEIKSKVWIEVDGEPVFGRGRRFLLEAIDRYGSINQAAKGLTVFTQPAPLTLPNRSGWAPGETLDLWSINPITGQFEVVGTGRVSDDGALVETISGGIRNSSCHYFLRNLGRFLLSAINQDQMCCSDPATVPTASEVSLHSGHLMESHELVKYESLSSSFADISTLKHASREAA